MERLAFQNWPSQLPLPLVLRDYFGTPLGEEATTRLGQSPHSDRPNFSNKTDYFLVVMSEN
jgi:hypothetical protein